MSIIKQIVDRCHTTQSYSSVLRYVISRMQPGAWESLPRRSKRNMISQVIERHNFNRRLYEQVTRSC